MTEKKLEASFSTFEKLLEQEFSIDLSGQQVRLKLVEVSELQPATTRTDLGIRQDPFSLIFKELNESNLQQGMYTVVSTTGSIDLFLVPVGFGEYQAIFN